MSRKPRYSLLTPVLLGGLALTLAFWNLGLGTLMPWDEALTGERIREMALDGNWLTPHLFEVPDFNKPPLYYLLSLPVWHLAGPGEFAVRFWSAVFAAGCAVLAYWCVVAAGLKRTWGLLAGLLLLANPHWQNWTRMGLLDSGLTLSVLGGLYLLAGPEISRRRALAAGLVLAAGSLLKFPVFLLVLPVAALARRLRHRRAAWRELALAGGLAAGITTAWVLVQLAVHGRAWLDFQKYNLADRFTTGIEGHTASSLIYWQVLQEFLPVQTAFLALALLAAAVAGRRGFRRAAPALLFLATWIALILLTASKRTPYLLPAYPFTAVATAILLGGVIPDRFRQAALAVMIGLALVDAVPHFRPVPDYSPRMAAVGDFLREHRQGTEFLFASVHDQRQNLAFYAATVPEYRRGDDLEEWIRRDITGSDKVGYLCIPASATSAVAAMLDRELDGDYLVEKAFANDGFSVFHLVPLPRQQAVQVVYLDGWQAQESWGRWINDQAATMRILDVPLPANLVIKTASWLPEQESQVCLVSCDGNDIGRIEILTDKWQWHEYMVELAGDGTRSLDLRFRFERRFRNPAGGPWRSLPVYQIRVEPFSPPAAGN